MLRKWFVISYLCYHSFRIVRGYQKPAEYFYLSSSVGLEQMKDSLEGVFDLFVPLRIRSQRRPKRLIGGVYK